MRGVLNDAVSIYFLDTTLAGAFCGTVVRRAPGRDSGRRVPGAR
jgi:hypothetical protein